MSQLLEDNYYLEIAGIVPRKHSLRYFKNINCIGEIKCQKELRLFYQSCDVIFNPSQVETFGLIPIEAISQQTPVVAYNHKVFEEIYHNFKFVSLVENRNYHDAIKEIYRFIEYKPKKNEWINEQDKLKDFSAQRFASRYQELYLKLMGGS